MHRISTTRSARYVATGFLAACILCLAGCVSSSSSRITVQEGVKFSKGKELDDLVKALDAQAITRSEYDELRQVIMRRPN